MIGYRLPKHLLLGAATASAQIEGGDVAHNWREWEKQGRLHTKDSFTCACDHWNRWKEDIDIMAAMGIETYRFSVEWARIEPKAGVFDCEAIRHYREEILYMKEQGIVPCLTLHHFTDPQWFARRGGFTNPANVKTFLRYVGVCVKSFGDLVSDYVTINEPNVYAFMGYAGQGFPPGDNNLLTARRVISVMAGCHIRAYERIHRMRKKMGFSDTKVGFALHMRAFAPMNSKSTLEDNSVRLSRWCFQGAVARAFLNGEFYPPLEKLAKFHKGEYADFLGINYYTRNHVVRPGDDLTRPQDPKNDYGWEIYPKGLAEVMEELYRICPRPIWVTESGTCDNDDSFRSLYLFDQLAVIARSSLPVERYYYWSLLDNFEWLDGESKRFGLVHVDFRTQRRTVKKSGKFYREIIGNHAVTGDMVERYLRGENYHT